VRTLDATLGLAGTILIGLDRDPCAPPAIALDTLKRAESRCARARWIASDPGDFHE
jgi:hypothetical protein